MLGNITRTLIAFAVMAMLAGTAAAAEPPSALAAGLGQSLTRINAQGREVRVVRGEPELSEQSNPFPEELSESPEPVPEPDDSSYQREWDNAGEDHDAVGQCGSPCGDCGCAPCSCTPFWAHRTYLFGEYLYLLPTDADMPHAFQQNGVGGPGTVPAGSVGVVQPDFESAYRAGFGVALGCYASLGISYSRFDSRATDSLAQLSGVGDTVASLVLHPNSANAGSTSSLVDASLDLDYQLADIEYRRLLSGNCRHAVNYGVGVRYAKLQQDFLQIGNFAPPTGTIQTTSDINFEGVGLRAGLDGERRIGCCGFSGYGKCFMNVLFGEFQSTYTQLNTITTVVQANSNWNDRRALPLLEYEVGLNWTSRRGHWRVSAGYYTAFWFNTITTQQFVQAVQNADFVDVGETVAFNGLVTRLEFRF